MNDEANDRKIMQNMMSMED